LLESGVLNLKNHPMVVIPSPPITTLKYPVALEAVSGGWIAHIPGWSAAKAIGQTRETAIEQLQQNITQLLEAENASKGEFFELAIELPSNKRQQLDQLADFFVSDPTFDHMLDYIELERQRDREEYFRELDEPEAAITVKSA
jgi:predicted RNase H-like HicB family nuclease